MQENRKPQARLVKDHNFDSHFATVVMIAIACYVALIYVLFPHHDVGAAPDAASPAASQPAPSTR